MMAIHDSAQADLSGGQIQHFYRWLKILRGGCGCQVPTTVGRINTGCTDLLAIDFQLNVPSNLQHLPYYIH